MSLKCILSVLKYNNVFMYIVCMYTYASVCELITVQYCTLSMMMYINGAIKGCNKRVQFRKKN